MVVVAVFLLLLRLLADFGVLTELSTCTGVAVCADYTFGKECEMTCQCADASEVCHPLTGQCRTGCLPGFTGRDCLQREL